jgi:DNA-binding NarL/FixJ family response regulator
MADGVVRILVVDDHEVVRRGVQDLVATAPDLEVCGEAATADAAVVDTARLRPDVVLMDVRLGDGSGIAATRDIRAADPEAKVLVFTAYGDDDALFTAILAGARGFILKQASGDELLHALRRVAAGESLLDPLVTASVLDRLREARRVPRDERLARLSRREYEVLRLVSDGLANHEIAQRIHLSEKTVKNHLTRIFAKLGVTRRTEAAAYYNRHGSPEDA